MKNPLALALLLAALCMMVPGTSPATDSDKGSAEALKKSARETLEAAKQLAQQEKQSYQQRIQTELDALAGRLNKLKQQANSAKGDALTKLNARIADLENKQRAATQKLGEIKSSGVQAWLHIKSGLDGAMNELKSAYEGLAGEAK